MKDVLYVVVCNSPECVYSVNGSCQKDSSFEVGDIKVVDGKCQSFKRKS